MSDVEIGVIYEECIEDEGMTQVPFPPQNFMGVMSRSR